MDKIIGVQVMTSYFWVVFRRSNGTCYGEQWTRCPSGWEGRVQAPVSGYLTPDQLAVATAAVHAELVRRGLYRADELVA